VPIESDSTRPPACSAPSTTTTPTSTPSQRPSSPSSSGSSRTPRRGHHPALELQGARPPLARLVDRAGGARRPRAEDAAVSERIRDPDFDSTHPLDQWPAEAIATTIDRGSLSDWRQLADAIRRNPWGPAARTTETITAWGEHYGVDALMSNVIHPPRTPRTHPQRTRRVRRADPQLAHPIRNDTTPARSRRRHVSITAVRLRERQGRTHNRRARQTQTRRRHHTPRTAYPTQAHHDRHKREARQTTSAGTAARVRSPVTTLNSTLVRYM
jgi:hypothetical protein